MNVTMLKGKKIVNKENGAVRLVVDVNEETNKLYVIPTDKDYAAPTPMAYASFTRRWQVLEETETPDEMSPATESKPTAKSKRKSKAPSKTETEAPTKTEAESKTPDEPIAKTETETEAKAPKTAAVTQMSDIVSKLEDLFCLLNRVYFEDSLPKPIITVQSTPRAYGHCSTKQIWRGDNESHYEINIGAEYINRSTAETAATMCHEMIHLYCLENKISDTCQHGRYHNKTFKAEAEKRDLIADYDRANGYTHTSATDAFKKVLEDNNFKLEVQFARVPPKEKAKADRAKAHGYKCPCCGQTVRSTSDLILICGVCNESMERYD